MNRRLFAIASAVSLLLCVATFGEELLRFPDNDFSFYWASNGRMISVDSFEDIPQANTITVRRLSPMPSDVPFHVRHCAVEARDDAPCAGIGNSVEVWVDKNGQPVGRREGGRRAGPMMVTVLAQVPLTHVGTFFLLAAFAPALWCVMRYRSWRACRDRRARALCVVCGYDLRASRERCSECGTPIPSKVEATA